MGRAELYRHLQGVAKEAQEEADYIPVSAEKRLVFFPDPSSRTDVVGAKAIRAEACDPAISAALLPYLPPPFGLASPGSGGKGKEESGGEAEKRRTAVLTVQLAGVEALLKAPHAVFWSHVLHDQAYKVLVDTYLRFAPRGWDTLFGYPQREEEKNPTKDSLDELESTLFRKMGALALRSVSREEDAGEVFFSAGVFGELLYDNWVWDVPKMLDFAGVYGPGNPEFTQQVLQSLCNEHSAYLDDWAMSVDMVVLSLSEFAAEAETPGAGTGAVDKLLFGVDAVCGLYQLMLAVPRTCGMIPNVDELVSVLGAVAGSALPSLGASLGPEFASPVETGIKASLGVLHLIFEREYLDVLLKRKLVSSASKRGGLPGIERAFRGLVASLAGTSPGALVSYEIEYLLSWVLARLVKDVSDAAAAEWEALSGIMVAGALGIDGDYVVNSPAYCGDADLGLGGSTPTPKASGGLPVFAVSDDAVAGVKAVFPELGDGFIAATLSAYDGSSTAVVDALLEDTLSPELDELDRDMSMDAYGAYLASTVAGDQQDEDGKSPALTPTFAPDERHSAFSWEELQYGKMYMGKSKAGRNGRKMDDSLKERILATAASSAMEDLYNDERDDSYDQLSMTKFHVADDGILESGRAQRQNQSQRGSGGGNGGEGSSQNRQGGGKKGGGQKQQGGGGNKQGGKQGGNKQGGKQGGKQGNKQGGADGGDAPTDHKARRNQTKRRNQRRRQADKKRAIKP